ncbi:hypothetical protein BGZ51_006224, partial [Haplosporangium sp. Z 767]
SVSTKSKVAIATEATSPAIPSSQSTQKAPLNDPKNLSAIKPSPRSDFKVSSMAYCISRI